MMNLGDSEMSTSMLDKTDSNKLLKDSPNLLLIKFPTNGKFLIGEKIILLLLTVLVNLYSEDSRNSVENKPSLLTSKTSLNMISLLFNSKPISLTLGTMKPSMLNLMELKENKCLKKENNMFNKETYVELENGVMLSNSLPLNSNTVINKLKLNSLLD